MTAVAQRLLRRIHRPYRQPAVPPRVRSWERAVWRRGLVHIEFNASGVWRTVYPERMEAGEQLIAETALTEVDASLLCERCFRVTMTAVDMAAAT